MQALILHEIHNQELHRSILHVSQQVHASSTKDSSENVHLNVHENRGLFILPVRRQPSKRPTPSSLLLSFRRLMLPHTARHGRRCQSDSLPQSLLRLLLPDLYVLEQLKVARFRPRTRRRSDARSGSWKRRNSQSVT